MAEVKKPVVLFIAVLLSLLMCAAAFAATNFTACDKIMYCEDRVNFRTEPQIRTGNVIACLKSGEKLQVTGENGEWSQAVRLSDGKKGYVASRYLHAADQTSADSSAKSADATAQSTSGGGTPIGLNPSWKYASYAKISSGSATLYTPAAGDKGITICVNAGHGTRGGSSVKTQCHPDGSAKVSGGTTSAGSYTAVAVSTGTEFLDHTSEASVTLACAKILRDKLLAKGYRVLMIRDGEDIQLDNVARTVIANNKADAHIALHWDSTENDKGAYYCSVADVASYRAMEPVASNWKKHHALGDALIQGLRDNGCRIWSGNPLSSDLTQLSYSTIPSVDIELGDRASDHSQGTLNKLAEGLANGVDRYFKN